MHGGFNPGYAGGPPGGGGGGGGGRQIYVANVCSLTSNAFTKEDQLTPFSFPTMSAGRI